MSNPPQAVGSSASSSKIPGYTLPSSSSNDSRSYTDYILYAPPKNSQDWHHHLLKFMPVSKNEKVDISTFQRPVKLNRRDERALREEGQEQRDPATPTEAQVKNPDRDESLVAPGPSGSRNGPSLAAAAARKRKPFEKKTSRVFQTEASLASRKLARQEQYPWLLEDALGKQRWVGRMVGGSAGLGGINDGATGGTSATKAGAQVIFRVKQSNNGMEVLPADRTYRFTPKLTSRNADADEAELEFERRSKSKVADRWGQRNKKVQLSGVKGEPMAEPVRFSAVHGQSRGRVKKEVDDEFDEVEYEEEVQDDEEGAGTYGDDIMEEEEAKILEERIKRSQRGGNHLSGDVDTTQAEQEFSKAESSKLNRAGKRAQKLLRKHKNSDDESGSDQDETKAKNPYATDSEDSEEEPVAEPVNGAYNQALPPHLTGDVKPKLPGAAGKGMSQTSRPGSRAGSPAAAPSPSLKRKAEDSGGDRPDKKLHKREGSAAGGPSDDPEFAKSVLTEAVVITFVKNASNKNEATAKNLLKHVKNKLGVNPRSPGVSELLQSLIKNTCTLEAGVLVLKPGVV